MKRTIVDRLYSGPVDSNGCLIFPMQLDKDGYGRIYFNGTKRLASRVAYALTHGEIPARMFVDHICRNRACVNPEHLRAVTYRTNAIENSVSIPALHAAQTHCIRGHELAGANLRIRVRNGHDTRVCIACDRARSARYVRKQPLPAPPSEGRSDV